MKLDQLRYCQHFIYRCDTAQGVALDGRAPVARDLLQLALDAHSATVRCRLQPRKGPVHAPLPPRQA